MKQIITLMISLIFACLSCNINGQSYLNDNKTEQRDSDSALISYVYDKIVSQLNTVNIFQPKRDAAIIKVLNGANFQNQTTVPMQLTGKKCPFVPYMLVVYDNKLDLLNIKLDSVYTLDLKDKIQTASWSPFNKAEIYILTIDEKRKPGAEYAYAINRKLFCLNLNTMQLSYLTTFIDYSKTIDNLFRDHYEPPTFFSEMSSLEIDKWKKIICTPCYYPWDSIEEVGCLPNLLSYQYEIKTKTTKLTNKLNIPNTRSNGEKLEFVKSFHVNIEGTNYLATKDSVILLSENNNEEFKIPLSVFSQNGIKVTDLFWRFHAYFITRGKVFSVSQEDAMDLYKGHVYLMDYKGNLLKRLGKDMGEFFQLTELAENNFLIDPQDSNFNMGQNGLYLYDSAFNLLKHYRNVYYYELNQ